MKNFINIILLLLISVGNLYAQLDRSKAPHPGPAPKIEIGNYTKFELLNGLKVFVVENHRLPRVSFAISFVFEPALEKENTGIGNLASELIGTGTKTRTKDQINDEIDFISGSLNTNSSGIYASSLKKHTSKLLEILSDVTINSVFNQEELDKKKNQTLSGLAANKDDPGAISENVSSALFFGKNHPYGEFETEASVKNITLDMCTQYYQSYFRPNIAYLSIVGDITPAEAKKLAEKYFSDWKKGDIKMQSYPKPEAPQANQVAIVDRPQSVQSNINIGYAVDLNLNNPDYIKARVTNTILGGGTFRLFNNLREKHAFTYGAYSNFRINPLASNFTAYANVRNAVTDSAISQIILEMKRLREEPVPAEELTMVKNYLTGNFSLSLENPQTIASFATNIERYKLPKDFYTNYLKNIEAVTAADVQETAKKYILPEKSTILVVGKASEIGEKLKKFSPDGKITYYDIEANPYDPNKKDTPIIPQNVTAQSVLSAYIDAIGGKVKLSQINDLTMKGTMSVQGMALSVSMIYKVPGKFLTDINMNGQSVQKIVLNGESGKSSGMQGSKELKGAELEKLKAQAEIAPELKYDKLGYKTELKGSTKINGEDTYIVDITSPSNDVTTDYYSAKTGLKIRSISSSDSPMGKISQTTDIVDYTEINGVKYPKKMKQLVGPQSIDITVDSIVTNTNVKDEIFQ